MRIKGFLKDITGFFNVMKERKKTIEEAKETFDDVDRVLINQKRIHPGIITTQVLDIKKEAASSARIRFALPKDIILSSGTYLSIKLVIDGHYVSRPYSIITSPKEAQENGYVEIIVKEKEAGFVSKYLTRALKKGDKMRIDVNQGDFSYNALRDKKDVLFIAGGVGVTPFISLSKDLLERKAVNSITLIYGVRNTTDILAKEELDELEKQGVKVIYVMSEEPSYKGEKGFVSKDIIKKYVDIHNVTFFICGPIVMVDYVKKELKDLDIDLRKVRYEGYIEPHLAEEKEYNLTIKRGLETTTIKAKANESLLVAIEKSGIKHDSSCRSGRCGYCHIKVIKGEYHLLDDSYIRYADKELGYVHSCITYPKSDLLIQIPIED